MDSLVKHAGIIMYKKEPKIIVKILFVKSVILLCFIRYIRHAHLVSVALYDKVMVMYCLSFMIRR